ncbi:MAG: CpaE family protein [Alphaproteobacteria bacterium]
MSSNVSFLAFTSDEKDVAILKQFAVAQGWPDSCVHQGNVLNAAEYLKSNVSPTLLLVEVTSAKDAPAQLDALAEVCDPNTKVVVTGTVNEYSFYCWLMDLGIFSYLLKPLAETMLAGMLAKLTEVPVAAGANQKQPGKVIAIMGTRGGVGTTALAINLAGVIAEQTKKKTALIDLDSREGSIALCLDLEPSRGLREALEKPDRIDSLFMERVMVKPNKYLSILSAEESLQEHIKIHEQASNTLLGELKNSYEYIILDVPRYLDAFSTKCLAAADHVVLATELTLLSLRDALRLQDLMRESLKMRPPVVVAMRTGLSSKNQVLLADFEKGINAKVAYSIPFTPDIFMPVGTEIAAVKHKSHAAVKPIYQLMEDIIPEAKMQESSKVEKKSGFLAKKNKNT